MVINSLSFLVFFVFVFALYYINVKWKRSVWQNVILLVASYFFYGYADFVMLPLFIGVTIVFYFLGLGIEKYLDTTKANWLMAVGVILGVGLLLYFKYANFFIGELARLGNAIGLHGNLHSLNILVPLGISYFTFKLLSYLIEIHRGTMLATRDFISFATYVAFFPCMLSGPIDRPDKFIPQLQKERVFNHILTVDGLRQILWGMFKKMAVADTIAVFVDEQLAMNHLSQVSGSTMIFVFLAYTFQIYADFSGYSDMAIGVGKVLGIKVTPNFRYPFFALNIADFWHRWHISLTSWMTDYVYLPLSFIFRGWRKWGLIVAIIINFVIVGMWHGAGWNYIIYGCYHGLLFVPLILLGTINTKVEIQTNKVGLPILRDLSRMLLTFVFVCFGMMIFRTGSIDVFMTIVNQFGNNFLSIPEVGAKIAWLMVVVMMAVEWMQRKREYGLEISNIPYRSVRWIIYLALLMVIYCRGGGEQHFIYQVF